MKWWESGKDLTETSNEVELQINHSRPVCESQGHIITSAYFTFFHIYLHSTEAHQKSQGCLKFKVNIIQCQGHIKVKLKKNLFSTFVNAFMIYVLRKWWGVVW